MLVLAFTTTSTREDAERLAREAVASGLADCVQIDGPVTSIYRWKGGIETAPEFRLLIKCTGSNEPALRARLLPPPSLRHARVGGAGIFGLRGKILEVGGEFP